MLQIVYMFMGDDSGQKQVKHVNHAWCTYFIFLWYGIMTQQVNLRVRLFSTQNKTTTTVYIPEQIRVENHRRTKTSALI